MNTMKKATTLMAIIGLALLLGGCDDQVLPRNNQFENAVATWQSGAGGPEFLVDNRSMKMSGEIDIAPFLVDIDDNGTLDLVVGDASGYIEIMINDSYDGLEITDSYLVGDASGPTYFCDDAAPVLHPVYQGEGWQMIVGCDYGAAWHVNFTDMTPGAMSFDFWPVVADNVDLYIPSGYAVPTLTDIEDEAEELPNLVVGAGDGIYFYQNVGELGAPVWEFAFNVSDFGTRTAVAGLDIDDNDATEYVIGNEAGEVWACNGLFNNCILVLQTAGLAKPTVGDINHDGLQDLVIGTADGSLQVIIATPATP